MPRPVRVFRPEAVGLEGRQLLTARVGSPRLPVSHLGFVGTSADGSISLNQQSHAATVVLSRTDVKTAMQVRVATTPSPAIGVNLGAVNQTVTFDPGQSTVSVNVPILAGAPNPREVDAEITVTPLNPPPNLLDPGPLKLRIMASADLIPPTIVAAQRTREGIALTFSKPMDPARVTNVANYQLRGTTTKASDTKSVLSAVFLGKWSGLKSQTYSGQVRLTAAIYDAGTRTVTLIPARPLDLSAQLVVTSGLQARHRIRPRTRMQPVMPLTDLSGNPISAGMSPGQFWVPVTPGRGA